MFLLLILPLYGTLQQFWIVFYLSINAIYLETVPDLYKNFDKISTINHKIMKSFPQRLYHGIFIVIYRNKDKIKDEIKNRFYYKIIPSYIHMHIKLQFSFNVPFLHPPLLMHSSMRLSLSYRQLSPFHPNLPIFSVSLSSVAVVVKSF